MTTPANQPPEAGAPAPKVVVLSDAMFFVRAVPAAGGTPIELASQAELALEAISPFPASQLYHGYFWLPGATQMLVFAAYRRRFTREQVESWSRADLVLPAFAALLGAETAPGTTMLVTSAEGITSIHWTDGVVPAAVSFRALPPEATEADRAAVRDELLKAAGGTKKVVELSSAPVPELTSDEDEFVFRADAQVSHLPAAMAASLDIRDKSELAALRRARGRDVILWRSFIGCLAAIVLVGIGWAGLYGAGFWQRTRERKIAAQQPVVDQVMAAQNLTTRVNELSSKRLLPLEMITQVSASKPASVQFLHATTDGFYTLRVEAQTNSPAEVSTFRSALAEQPACANVEVSEQRTRDNIMSFTLVVTFKPEALKPATSS